jgi:purine nucleosidase
MPPMPVLLDTDIGTDVDDCLALAFLLASPEIELCGITTVYGDTLLRARMALKLLALRGAMGIPVAVGAARPLVERGPIYWEGHEGEGLLEPGEAAPGPDAIPAAGLIGRLALARPGALELLAIGPLTNVALALQAEPRLAGALAGVTLMGGAVAGADAPGLPVAEHNFRCDPEAAAAVLGSGLRLRIVPLDVTTRVRLWPGDVAALAASGDPFHEAVAGQVRRYPRYRSRGWTYLHDPLAAAALLRPELLRWQPAACTVDVGEATHPGRLRAAPDPGSLLQIALDVDAPAAERYIVARLPG